MSILNQTSYFIFGSPRYNASTTFPTIKIPEQYTYYTGLNGTYDKFFPLYKLTSSDSPSLQLVDNLGNSSNITGDLSIRNTNYKSFRDTFGKNDNRSIPKNSNLEEKEVSYSYWSNINLNPAWCVIQTQVDTSDVENIEYSPVLLVRSLGNTNTTRQVHALDLDKQGRESQWASADFPVGIIVKYKDNIWKCIKSTRQLPPDRIPTVGDVSNDNWQLVNLEGNVFNADLFALGKNGASGYLLEVSDKDRKFDPSKDNVQDELVCWNMAYYHSRI